MTESEHRDTGDEAEWLPSRLPGDCQHLETEVAGAHEACQRCGSERSVPRQLKTDDNDWWDNAEVRNQRIRDFFGDCGLSE